MAFDDDVDRLLAAQLRFCQAPPDIDVLHQLLVELSQEVTGADGAVLEVVDGEDLVYDHGSGLLAGTEGTRVKRDGSLSGLAIATGEPQVSSDVFADTRTDRDACRALGIGSMVVQPIRRGHDTTAVVKVAVREAHGVSERQRQLLAPFVQLAATRLAHVAALLDRSAADKILSDVGEASRAILVAADPTAALCTWSARLTGAPFTAFLEPDMNGTLRTVAQHGPAVPAFELPPGTTSIMRTAFDTARLQVVPDWTSHPQGSPLVRAALTTAGLTGTSAGAAVPVVSGDRPVGVLALVFHDRVTAAGAGLLGLVSMLAREAGVAIERNELQHRLEQQARSDDLTALPNRRVWNERLALELARAGRSQSPLCLTTLDLDHFKTYNDTQGHQAGDALLRAVADAWVHHIRETDLLARLGGEEFALLLPDTPVNAARAITQRLLDNVPAGATASAGIASWQGEAAEVLYRRADAALYAAKAAGRNQLAVASGSD